MDEYDLGPAPFDYLNFEFPLQNLQVTFFTWYIISKILLVVILQSKLDTYFLTVTVATILNLFRYNENKAQRSIHSMLRLCAIHAYLIKSKVNHTGKIEEFRNFFGTNSLTISYKYRYKISTA